jgi:archaellum component FlaC
MGMDVNMLMCVEMFVLVLAFHLCSSFVKLRSTLLGPINLNIIRIKEQVKNLKIVYSKMKKITY